MEWWVFKAPSSLRIFQINMKTRTVTQSPSHMYFRIFFCGTSHPLSTILAAFTDFELSIWAHGFKMYSQFELMDSKCSHYTTRRPHSKGFEIGRTMFSPHNSRNMDHGCHIREILLCCDQNSICNQSSILNHCWSCSAWANLLGVVHHTWVIKLFIEWHLKVQHLTFSSLFLIPFFFLESQTTIHSAPSNKPNMLNTSLHKSLSYMQV